MEKVIVCKIHFLSAIKAREALLSVRNIFKEGIEAYKFWKRHRGKQKEIFWQIFAEKFPNISEYLRMLEDSDNDIMLELRRIAVPVVFGGDHHNGLAGRLGFGDLDNVDEQMVVKGRTICFKAQAWDLREWDPFFAYVAEKFTAQRYSNKKLEEYTRSLASLERWSVIKEKENEPAFPTNV